MSFRFSHKNNCHIYIRWDVYSRKEWFLHSIIYMYRDRIWINLMFSNPKRVELVAYKDI